MHDKFKDGLSELASDWNRIEERLKEAEQVREEVVIPAINELRYTGRQIVDAWSITLDDSLNDTQKEEKLNERMAVAKQYFMNADHDITDAICTFLHGEIRDALNNYGHDIIIKYCNNLLPSLQKIEEANQTISISRSERKKRKEKYAELRDNYIPEIIKFYNDFCYAEKKILIKEKRKAIFNRVISCFAWVFAVVGFLGSMASILALFFAPNEAQALFSAFQETIQTVWSELAPPAEASLPGESAE